MWDAASAFIQSAFQWMPSSLSSMIIMLFTIAIAFIILKLIAFVLDCIPFL